MRCISCLLVVFVFASPSITSAQYRGRTPARAPRTAAVPRATQPSPAGRQAVTQHPTASPEKVEAAVNQRIASLQQMMARESKNLEAQLSNLEKKRQVAIDKGDDKTLKSIEQLENKIVKNYEQKVSRLVASMSAAPNARQVGNAIPRNAKNNPNPNKSGAKKQAPAPKKRFRLWPF